MNKRIIAGLVVGGVAVAGAAVGIGIGLSPQMYEVKIESEQEEARFDGSGKYKIGQQVELLAEAPEGYEFAYWLFNDTAVSEENPYIFKLTKENFGTYTAVFSKQLSVTVDQGISHGQVSSSVEKTIAGKEVTVTVTPDEHYRLSKLYYEVADDENEYNINMQTFKFNMPEKDVIIHAEFTDCIYSVSTAQGISNGQLTIVPVEGKNGTEVIVTPSADTGYYLKDLFYVKEGDEENPVTIEENEDVYSFILSSNVTVHATFLQIEYEIAEFSQNVTLKKGEQVLTKDDTLHYNDEIEVTYSVPEGYHLTEFEVTGLQKVQGEDNLYKVIGDVSIDYQIEIDTFAINFAEGEGFVLEPIGQVDLDNIAYDTNFKFTITLDEGYDQSNYVVKVNNQVVEEVDGMFTINVRGNKNVTVEGVELNTYTVPEFSSRVTIRKNDNIISTGDTLTYGDELVITYSESYGHTMTEFSVQGVERVEGKENTYKVVGDLSITYAEEVSKYTVTLTQGTGYTLSSEDDLTEIEHGSFVTISLSINDAYNQSVPVVKANGSTISGNGDSTYTVQVLDDLTITVEGVEINKYAVTLTQGDGYTLSSESDLTQVEHNSVITITLSIDDAYNQSTPVVRANGSVIGRQANTYNYPIIVSSNTTITVEGIEINKYDVTLSQGVGYELQTEDSLEDVAHGSSISFTLALGEGYNQSTPVVKANGEVIYADEGTYTVEITEDTTITVEDVEINNYSVTLTEGTGYTLAVVGEINLDEVEYNSNVSFTLTLDDNYNQSTPVVKVNNEAIEANDGVYTINVKEDKVVTVSDVQGNVYNVLSFDDEYVAITKDGEPVTVSDDLRYGDEIVITYELDEGYKIKTFTVEGAEESGENVYIVKGNITITFEQEIMSFSLTIINENQFPIGFKDQDIDLSEIEYGTEVFIYADSILDGDLEYYSMIVDENGQELYGEWDSDDQKYYYSLTITENTTISVINYEYVAALSGFNSEFMVKEGDGNSFIIYDNNDNPTHFGVEYYYDEDEQVGKYVGMIGVGIPLNYDTSQMTLTLGDEVIEPVDVIEGIQLGPDTYGNAFIYNIEMNQNGLILSLNNVQIQTFDINIYDEDGENILYTDEVEYGQASQYKDLTFTKESDDPNYVYQFMGFAELDGEDFMLVDLTNITKDLELRPVFMQRAVLEYELNENEDGYILKSWYYAGTDKEATITIPSEYEGLPVTEIGEGAFALPQTIGAEKLNYVTPYTPNLKVNLPSTIQKIGDGAFYNCPQVDVDFTQFDNLTYIGNSAFQGTGVKKVILDKIERIGSCAFVSCQALTEISIPSTLERLGATFEYYTTLGKTGYQYTGGKDPGLQPWVEPTDVYTFADCVNLAKVDWEASVYPSGHIFENSGSASGIEFTLAGNVTIAPDLYTGRISELHILADELVDGETRSEIEHLSSCSAESIIVDSASVAQAILGDNNNLSDLRFTKLYIANGLDDGTQQTISFYSFDATQAATSDKAGYVLYDTEIEEISVGDMSYTKNDDDHTLVVNGVDSSAPRIKIPETVEINSETYTITQVYIYSYYDEVTLPRSLSYVGFGNGFGEVKLYGTGTNLTFKDNNDKILYVDNGEEVIVVGASRKLSSGLMLSDDVTIIGAGAFANTNITSVNWSDLTELRMIGQGAFYMTQHLDEVIIPEGVTTILPDAFCGCGATYVSIPESVESLYINQEQSGGGSGIIVAQDSFYTFAGMTNLKTLVWDAAYINDISVMANPEIFAGSGCAEGVEVTFGEHANDLSIFTGASTYSGDYSNILYGIPMRIKKLTITQDGSRNEEGYPFNAQGSINVFNIGLLPNAEVIIDSEMLAEGLLEMGVAGMLFNLYDMYYPGSYNTSTWEWEADYSEANIKLYINDEFLEEPIQSEIVGAGDGISVVFTHNASTDKEGYQLYNLSYISKSGNGGGSGGGATPIFVP